MPEQNDYNKWNKKISSHMAAEYTLILSITTDRE